MMTLEDLPGIGPKTAEKLKEAGYKTVESIAVASPRELSDIAELGEGVGTKIIEKAREICDVGGFITAAEMMEKRKSVLRISTGSKKLDELMGGGFETQTIIEMYGEFGSGKSQMAHQMCVMAQLPIEKGGVNGKVLFIDTESTFRPDRITQIAKFHGLDPSEVLNNIYVAKAFNSDHQMLLVEKGKELVDKENVKVFIVDSLTSLFRSEYVGRGMLSDRQQKLGRHLRELHNVAMNKDVCVYVTNQVSSKPDAFFGDPTRPIGGHILGHASTIRIYLRKGKAGQRVAKMVDSPNLPEGEAMFYVTENGVEDK